MPTCVNADCTKTLDVGSSFCPFCATPQPAAEADAAPKATPEAATLGWSSGMAQPATADEDAPLVLRASDRVWHFEEDEAEPKPAQPRPLLVVDEQVVHLAHTDRTLSPEQLLCRVAAHLERQGVPVDTQLKPARWQSDTKETRPRVIAWLRNHAFSDMKMLLGVDYLGGWASIEMQLAVEPEPLPKRPKYEPAPFPPGPGILLMLGIIVGFIGYGKFSERSGDTDPILWLLTAFVGALCALGGLAWIFATASAHSTREQERRAKWEAEQEAKRRGRLRQRLLRTHKTADMCLFSTTMRQVFQSVVDDIVEQGGEVARIEGGQGGFFRTSEGLTQASPSPRRSDAAQAAV